MRLPPIVCSTLILLASPNPAQANAPPAAAIPPDRAVGIIYGKTVTAADIGLTAPIDRAVKFDARDDARWDLMGRILTAFGKPINDRFQARQKIQATPNEIEKFKVAMRAQTAKTQREKQARLARIKADLARPDLPEPDKAKLEKERAIFERGAAAADVDAAAPANADIADQVARQLIVAWKTERELHLAYPGGRIIFQQFGPEALDARRKLYEEAEKTGDLKFADPGVRHLFYYYCANMGHADAGENALDRPWFLGD
jgi:hypothetical protein